MILSCYPLVLHCSHAATCVLDLRNKVWTRYLRLLSTSAQHALFQYPSAVGPVEKSCIEVLDPLVNADTNNHSDVEAFLNRVYAKICQLGVRMGVVFGDEQTVSLIWSQIAEYPNEHMGYFHFLESFIFWCI